LQIRKFIQQLSKNCQARAAALLRTVMRCFVNLDQLDGLTQNDSVKRLALPNIVCEVNSIM